MWYLVALDVLLQACASVHHWHPPDQRFSGGHRSGIHICRRVCWYYKVKNRIAIDSNYPRNS